jgi:asparagine synthase (glutamine-hydrolysing)
MEFGVALGGTAILLSSELEERRFHGFDVFGMIPPPSEKDESDSHARFKAIREGKSRGLGEDKYYGYMDDLYQKVIRNFENFGLHVDQNKINLHKSLFEESVHFKSDDVAALAHIDCDWYEPVRFCMESVSSIMPSGGIIIIDDYNDYLGCKNAVKDTISSDRSLIIEATFPHAIVRKS